MMTKIERSWPAETPFINTYYEAGCVRRSCVGINRITADLNAPWAG
jgi:hypothetical protein